LTFSPVTTASGVYGGTLRLAGSSGFRLTGYAVAPGTRVSGLLTFRPGLPLTFAGTLRVAGAASGKLHVSGHTLKGVLEGRRFSGRV
jgi:hypothetical protein